MLAFPTEKNNQALLSPQLLEGLLSSTAFDKAPAADFTAPNKSGVIVHALHVKKTRENITKSMAMVIP